MPPLSGPSPREQLARILASVPDIQVKPLTFKPGEVIFTEGSSATGCYLIESGSVQLLIGCLTAGTTTAVQTLRAGELLGLSGVLHGGRFQFTAVAMLPTTVQYIARTDLFLLFREDAKFRDLVLSVLCSNLDALMRSALQVRKPTQSKAQENAK